MSHGAQRGTLGYGSPLACHDEGDQIIQPVEGLDLKRVGALAVALTLALGAGACGDDGDDQTTEASAEKVTVTTSDTTDGYTWEVSPAPTAETKSVTLQNESEDDHALIFARLGEGYTVDEAYEVAHGGLQAVTEGSATDVIPPRGVAPGESGTAVVTEPLDPGDYFLLCPLAGKDGPHYKLGQLAEFAIE